MATAVFPLATTQVRRSPSSVGLTGARSTPSRRGRTGPPLETYCSGDVVLRHVVLSGAFLRQLP